MVSDCSLSDSESPQVSGTLLTLFTILNNVVVWMVSIRPPSPKSSSPFNNLLVIVPKAPIIIGIIITFMFHSFFNSLASSTYLSFFSHSFSFILWPAGTAKSTILQYFLLFLFTPFWVFYINISQWFLTGVWVTASFLKSPRLFSVFWPISIML